MKFDVTSSDGAGNGFNYEDGTFEPAGSARAHREHQQRAAGSSRRSTSTPRRRRSSRRRRSRTSAPATNNAWLGAQATIQRWYADPVVSNERHRIGRCGRSSRTTTSARPRTSRWGCTRGSSSSPTSSQWQDPVSGVFLGTQPRPPARRQRAADRRWRADGLAGEHHHGRHERQLSRVRAGVPGPAAGVQGQQQVEGPVRPLHASTPTATPPAHAVGVGRSGHRRSTRRERSSRSQCRAVPEHRHARVPDRHLLAELPERAARLPCQPGIGTPTSAPDGPLERLPIDAACGRDVERPAAGGAKINSGCSGAGCFTFAPPQFGVEDTDPYTPMLRAYEGDKVQIRTLVGAHMSPHYLHGARRELAVRADELQRLRQHQRLSRHAGHGHLGALRVALHACRGPTATNGAADYLYSPSSDTPGLSNGNWGIMRGYRAQQPTPALVAAAQQSCRPRTSRPRRRAADVSRGGAAEALQRRCRARARRPGRSGRLQRAGPGRSRRQPAAGQPERARLLPQAGSRSDDRDAPAGHAGRAADPARQRGRLHQLTLENRIPDVPLNIGSSSLGIPSTRRARSGCIRNWWRST